jgi:hypothetical protein
MQKETFEDSDEDLKSGSDEVQQEVMMDITSISFPKVERKVMKAGDRS